MPDRAFSPAEIVARLLARRQELFSAGAPGVSSATALSCALDEALVGLASAARTAHAPRRPWSVAALGGYGAGRLLPYSDVDLLIAVDGRPEDASSFVSALLYPLWDAGLTVGHAVRDRRAALQAASEDLATLTTMLTARHVTGDRDVFGSVVGAVATRAGRSPARVLAALAMRERPGSPFELWPDLKDGRGGQRDLDELRWTSCVAAAHVGSDLGGLVPEGLLRDEELARCLEASNLLTTARWWAHLVHGRGDNRYDEETDDAFGRGRALNAAMADVDAVTTLVRRRAEGAYRSRGAGRRGHASPPAVDGGLPSGPAAMLEALGSDDVEPGMLERAAWAGALEPMLPGWRDLMTLRRPGLTHRLTVGAHSLATARIAARAGSYDARAAAILATLEDTRPLLAAALLHDVGKRTSGPDHGMAGGPIAREAALRLGLSGPQALAVATLVRDHLLLVETIATADLDDEDAITTVAARLADPELVGPLYVLTLADSIGTSPDEWSAWKAALLGELAGKVERALRGGDPTGVAAHAAAVRDEVIASSRYEQVPNAIVGFARGAPLRYLAEHTPDEVLDHARLAFGLAQGSRAASARIEVRSGPVAHTWQVTVVALDRPGLLSLLAGVIALTGLDILSVSAHTTTRGVALDTFVLTGATLAEVGPETWARFERSLMAALAGRLAVPVRLAERRRHYARTERAMTPRVKITADDFATILSVRCADRVGLLHDLASALADAGLDIRTVTASSADGLARDTFRVVDGAGEPVTDQTLLGSLSSALAEAALGGS